MPHDEPSKTLEKSAAEVCVPAAPGEEARGLLAAGMTVRAYLAALARDGLHVDALRVLAHALPKREAVWWACLAAADAMEPEPSAEAAAALEAARAWVIEPTDEKRRAAFPVAQAAGLGTPVGCAAAAAYFSGGSLAPPDLPVVAPPEDATGKMVANGLVLSAVIKEPEKAAEKHAAHLRTGLEIADGGRPWPKSDSQASRTAPRAGEAAHAATRRPSH
jgi:hypothetical protein